MVLRKYETSVLPHKLVEAMVCDCFDWGPPWTSILLEHFQLVIALFVYGNSFRSKGTGGINHCTLSQA
eukprot:6458325-Amphidinium_carterae.1